jgi:signal transduction histidine kinase
MHPARRRQAIIACLGLTIVAGLGALAHAVSQSDPAAHGNGAAGTSHLALGLLSGLALTALAGLALLLRLLARGEELRRANAALAERNRELERASTAKNRFVASLSHELRNPLGAVIGYAELMGSGRFGALDARQQEHLDLIQESGQHMLALIDELLDMARIEAGHLRLENAPVDPAAVVRGCAAALRTMAEQREIQIELETPSSGLVMLDPTRLRQVVLNFVSNAIKFSPPAGTVNVRLRHTDGGISVEVSDAGPGLTPADQARVFEEFFQARGSERTGTGLGLAVTRLIVEAQGGRVAVHSRPGAGSTFSAWFPAADADAVVDMARPPLSLSLPPATVRTEFLGAAGT